MAKRKRRTFTTEFKAQTVRLVRPAADRMPVGPWRVAKLYGRPFSSLLGGRSVCRAANGCSYVPSRAGTLAPACAQRTPQLPRRASLGKRRIPLSPRSKKMRT